MRLLETETLELEEFFEKDIPPYAILSHRWERDEVTYQDMIIPSERPRVEGKYGFAKVRGACKVAQSQGHEYIWIDTCCIDKTSSAELTEAINSMYNWYAGAEVCYAFLSDIVDREALTSSLWFTRGWTLQELIAPCELEFYSATWTPIGNRKEQSIKIFRKTGIGSDILEDGHSSREKLKTYSIARRMSWASTRKTKRVEDEAYCLMGLFDVNMPLIYGEGRKAFLRLQEEIMRMTNDQSIFAWYYPRDFNHYEDVGIDILASSTEVFRFSTVSSRPLPRAGQKPITVTSQGISLELTLMAVDKGVSVEHSTEVYAILDCQTGNLPGTFPVIQLRRVAGEHTEVESLYYRVSKKRVRDISTDSSALTNDSPVVGLDTTQLSSPFYKGALDHHECHWQRKQITLTRSAPRVNILPPDVTIVHDYWIVSTWIYDISAHVEEAYPTTLWDRISWQFRTSKYYRYNGGTCMVLDGALGLRIASRTGNTSLVRRLRSNVSLLIGHAGIGENVVPWCHLIYDGEMRDLARSYSEYKKRVMSVSKEMFSDNNGQTQHWLELGHYYYLKASVKKKEVSGVKYYVVCLESQKLNSSQKRVTIKPGLIESLEEHCHEVEATVI